MGAMASQIISLTIVYLTVYSGADQRKYQSSAWLLVTAEFPAQVASNVKNISIWWRHHDVAIYKWTTVASTQSRIARLFWQHCAITKHNELLLPNKILVDTYNCVLYMGSVYQIQYNSTLFTILDRVRMLSSEGRNELKYSERKNKLRQHIRFIFTLCGRKSHTCCAIMVPWLTVGFSTIYARNCFEDTLNGFALCHSST